MQSFAEPLTVLKGTPPPGTSEVLTEGDSHDVGGATLSDTVAIALAGLGEMGPAPLSLAVPVAAKGNVGVAAASTLASST